MVSPVIHNHIITSSIRVAPLVELERWLREHLQQQRESGTVNWNKSDIEGKNDEHHVELKVKRPSVDAPHVANGIRLKVGPTWESA